MANDSRTHLLHDLVGSRDFGLTEDLRDGILADVRAAMRYGITILAST